MIGLSEDETIVDGEDFSDFVSFLFELSSQEIITKKMIKKDVLK
tara:strand:- start:273 stop:404 length:132 start_codon:yes stop_codon:yes gene_type:complete